MSVWSEVRHPRTNLDVMTKAPRQRWLAASASAVIASAAIAGAGFVSAPATPIAAPTAYVQEIGLVAIPSWITDTLTLLGLEDATLGSILGPMGTTTVDDALNLALGSFGSETLGSLLGPMFGTDTVDSLLTSMGLGGDLNSVVGMLDDLTSWAGFGVSDITLGQLEQWTGIPDADMMAALVPLGLTANSTLEDLLSNSTLNLGEVSFPDLLGGLIGIDPSDTLGDAVLGMLGLNGAQTVSDALASMLGLDGDMSLITGLGDVLGIAGLSASTSLADLLNDLFGGMV